MKSRMKIMALLGVVFLVGLVSGCARMRSPGIAFDTSMPAMVASASPVPISGEGMQVAETAGIELSSNITDRLITYDATLNMVVQNINATLKQVQSLANETKGYMQGMTQDSIVLRIPAGRLNEVLQRVEKMGEITHREIKGTDITEEMLDLDIRQRNLQEMRERLLKLLDKGTAVEDLLKAEKELERVTESLELLKGRVKFLAHAVAYSTLTLRLNSPVPQTEMKEVIPFDWVRRLGEGMRLDGNTSFVPIKRWRSWIRLELPPSYVKLEDRDGLIRAMSGSGVMILLRREENFEGGTLDFWSKIIRRWLVGNQVMSVGELQPISLTSGADGRFLMGTRFLGRTLYQYRLGWVVTPKAIYTFECWGTDEEMAHEKEALDKAFLSLKIKP